MGGDSINASTTIGRSGTLDLGQESAVAATPPALPALTVIHHPDLERVGERAVLGELGLLGELGRGVELSRSKPLFTAPGGLRERPLADRHLSRSPWHLRPAPDGGIELGAENSRTRLRVDGTPVVEQRVLSRADIDRGVVLELADRVVLLLHTYRILEAAPPPAFGLVGDSSPLLRVRMEIQRVADLDVPVLLRGETGTGKELVASALHQASNRQGEFVAVNLGAIPATLASSELFGARRGAFTGAAREQPGYFLRADGGTLLLDEIGEAPAGLQVQLLRVLETGEIQPLGVQQPRSVDVRLVAATDADLESLIEAGRFRAPLLHRLAGYEIWLPPLRQRRDDFGRLFKHFLRRELEAVGEADRLGRSDTPSWLPSRLVARLATFDWPGNVRQLRNAVRQIVVGSRGLPALELGPAVERLLQETAAPEPAMCAAEEAASEPGTPVRRKPATISEDELREVLRAHRWNLKAAASELRISRTSLYALIDQFPKVRAPVDVSNEEIRRVFDECGGDLEAMIEELEISRRALQRRLRELRLASAR